MVEEHRADENLIKEWDLGVGVVGLLESIKPLLCDKQHHMVIEARHRNTERKGPAVQEGERAWAE